MTNQEYAKLLSQLPKHVLKEYGFCKPFDFSKHECIHTTAFDYYPKLNCVVINNIPIVWHEDIPYADPRKPKHLKEFQRIAKVHTAEDTVALISVSEITGKMHCTIYRSQNKYTQQFIKKKGFIPMPFEEGDIYYIPDNIDLPNNPEMLLLAKCMFTAKKYNAIHLLPEPNISPRYWEDTIWMPSEDHTGMVKIFEKENYLTINVSFDRKNHTFTRINSDGE